MRILLDTNILVSGLIYGGTPYRLIHRLVTEGHCLLVPKHVEDEFKRIVELKWPVKCEEACRILRQYPFVFCDNSPDKFDSKLDDDNDTAILHDAIYHSADVILTGDKHFLKAGLTSPWAMTVSELDGYLANTNPSL